MEGIAYNGGVKLPIPFLGFLGLVGDNHLLLLVYEMNVRRLNVTPFAASHSAPLIDDTHGERFRKRRLDPSGPTLQGYVPISLILEV